MNDLAATAVPSDDELTNAVDEDGASEGMIIQADYDTVFAAVARRSMRLASLTNVNPALARSLQKVVHGFDIFSNVQKRNTRDIKVRVLTPSVSRIVVSLD